MATFIPSFTGVPPVSIRIQGLLWGVMTDPRSLNDALLDLGFDRGRSK